jgi:hypothetical protein
LGTAKINMPSGKPPIKATQGNCYVLHFIQECYKFKYSTSLRKCIYTNK